LKDAHHKRQKNEEEDLLLREYIELAEQEKKGMLLISLRGGGEDEKRSMKSVKRAKFDIFSPMYDDAGERSSTSAKSKTTKESKAKEEGSAKLHASKARRGASAVKGPPELLQISTAAATAAAYSSSSSTENDLIEGIPVLEVEYPTDEDDNANIPFYTQTNNGDEIIEYSELNYKMYPLGTPGELHQDFDDTITDSEAKGLLHDLGDRRNQFLFYRRRIGTFCYVEVIRVEKKRGTCYIIPKNPHRGWKLEEPEDDEWKAIEYSCLIHLQFSDGPKAKGIKLPGHYLLVQDTLRRPFSETTRESRIDHNRTMTQYLSDQGPVKGGLMPIDMQGTRFINHVTKKGKKTKIYLCEFIVDIDSDGKPVGCKKQRVSYCGNMCVRHCKEVNKRMYGESIIPTDYHIRDNCKSSAKTVYDELISKYYNNNAIDNDAIDNDDEYYDTGDDSELLIWINTESKLQQKEVIDKFLTELKERVKNVKFLTTIEGKWYEMKENEVYKKVTQCFTIIDYNKNREYYVFRI
jgi:hypothetical protein